MSQVAKQTVTVADAVKAAAANLREFMTDVQDLLVEEVEVSDDERYWLITLGFRNPFARDKWGETLEQRTYKVFKIDRETGQVRSMKIRELTDGK